MQMDSVSRRRSREKKICESRTSVLERRLPRSSTTHHADGRKSQQKRSQKICESRTSVLERRLPMTSTTYQADEEVEKYRQWFGVLSLLQRQPDYREPRAEELFRK